MYFPKYRARSKVSSVAAKAGAEMGEETGRREPMISEGRRGKSPDGQETSKEEDQGVTGQPA